MAAVNTSPLPASAEGNLSRNIKGRFATSAPRKRRDAAPRSRYWMRPWPHHAALAARLGFEAARNSSYWPDMLKIRYCFPLPSDFDLRRPAWHRRLGRARPGAANDDAMAQMNQARPAAAGCAGQSDLHPARRTVGDHRPRRRQRRSGQGRADPPLSGSRRPSSRANSIASRCRPSAWAAKARASSRCSTAGPRSAVRSTTRSSRCAAISTRSPPAWSVCAAAASAAPTAKTSAARC